jgi:hypothetical protein
MASSKAKSSLPNTKSLSLGENKAFNFISLNKLDTTKSIFVANDSGQKIDVSGQAGFFLYQPGKNKADFSGRLKA